MTPADQRTPAYWRVGYYLAWMAPTLIASFANYTVAASSNPDASWPRYFIIHFFYWLAWGLIGEIAYKASPALFSIRRRALVAFSARHMLVFLVVTIYFSFYFVLINRAQFSGITTAEGYLTALYARSGSVLFHVMNAVTYLFILVAALLLKQSRYARSQELERLSLESKARSLEASLAEAKLSVLNNQIHPHFLFNAMNNIASLIEAQDNKRAYEAVAVLGRLLRKTFEYVRRKSILLKEELDLIQAMMRIGELRFGSRFSWECACDPELYTEQVPPFIVQPLVENALRHGVEGTAGPVHVRIQVRRDRESLLFDVLDNGPGAREGSGVEVGVGLQSLKERLRLMGGEDPLILNKGANEKGFQVTFRLPLGAKE